MDDAALVREVDRETDLHERAEQLVQRVDARGGLVAAAEGVDHVLHGRAADALHREEGVSLAVHAEVVDGHDRRMLELALHASLANEARA